MLGSRHSFNAVADSTELISLDGLRPDVAVDHAAGTVGCAPGVRYSELVQALAVEGVALHNLASLPHISVAGAVATATHGSGDGNGNLATAVAGLELVTSNGELLTVNAAPRTSTVWSSGSARSARCSKGLAAIATMRELADSIRPLLQVCEIRTIASDDLWMSPQYRRDSVGIHVTWHPDQAAVDRALALLEAALAPFGARPHWGKLFVAEAAAVAPLYPRPRRLRAPRRTARPPPGLPERLGRTPRAGRTSGRR